MIKGQNKIIRIIALLVLISLDGDNVLRADGQFALDSDTTVSVLNRSARVKADGTWQIDNVPANFGPVRVRATSVKNGITRSGQSGFVVLQANVFNGFNSIQLGNATPIPTKVALSVPSTTLTHVGTTSQVSVIASYTDSTSKNISTSADGTSFTISNPAVATIDANGLVTAVSSGTVLVSALNEGAIGILRINVAISSTDSDGDGLNDDIELANGMNPNDPVDAKEDPDRDGLSNAEELTVTGTNRLLNDTDGDGISDGDEVAGKLGRITNPLLKDTDGDLISDALEFQAGTDPTNNLSFNFGAVLQSLTVSPDRFVLTVNSIAGDASRQLKVMGILLDGSSVDLTSTARGTNYNSSDLGIANFGSPDGNVFAGSGGSATITINNGAFTATAAVTVLSTSPTALGSVAIPGFANKVDVSGAYAFVAAGSAGLQVVDISNKSNPQIVAALDTPGTALDIRVVGSFAYVADGENGLQIISIANALAPVLIGAVDTPGKAYDVAVEGGTCYVADGSAGLQVIDVSTPSAPQIIGSFATRAEAFGVATYGLIAGVAENGGLEVLSIANPSAPQLRGSLNFSGEVRDITIEGNYAYTASWSGGFTVIDLRNPQSPQVVAANISNTNPYLSDVAVSGRFGMVADYLYLRDFSGIPIIDLQSANNPVVGSLQPFSVIGNIKFPTGITMDGSYAYLTADSSVGFSKGGATGDSRLYIGQYFSLNDTSGIAPTVSISEPPNGALVIQNETITVEVAAADDVGVKRVQLFANGVLVGVDSAAPFEFTYTAPNASGQVLFTATAIDYGANSSTSAPAFVEIVPDPGSAITGRFVDSSGQPVVGANAIVYGTYSTTSDSNGVFNFTGLPSILGEFFIRATTSTLFAKTGLYSPIPGGAVDVGTITMFTAVRITNPIGGAQIIQSATSSVDVAVEPGVSVAKVELFANGTLVGSVDSAPYQFSYTAPAVLGQVILTAKATDLGENVITSAPITVQIVPDPGTTVTGRILDMYGRPVVGAKVSALGAPFVFSDGAGRFQLPGVSTVRGNFIVKAVTDTLLGESSELSPLVNGVVDAGDITIQPRGYFVDLPDYANDIDVSGNYAYVADGFAGLQVVDTSDKRNPRIVAALDTQGRADKVRVAGDLAYVSVGASLRIVSILDPLLPVIIGNLNVPDQIADMAVSGTLCYLAAGSSGVFVADVTNPLSPVIIGHYQTANYDGAQGVALSGSLAVVSTVRGLDILSIVDPANPTLLGKSANPQGGSYYSQVAVRGVHAFAIYQNAFNVIDFKDPQNPILVSAPLYSSIEIPEIAIDRQFAFIPGGYYTPTVKLFDLRNPVSPVELSPINFSERGVSLTMGSSVALDGHYMYVTTSNREGGESPSFAPRLYIGQYSDPTAGGDVAPSVSITDPLNDTLGIANAPITVKVAAADDVSVDTVKLFADGVLVGVDYWAPYEFNYTAPTQPGQVTLTATATDFSGNSTTSAATRLNIVADPGMTVVGRLVDINSLPLVGVRVAVFGSYTAFSDAAGYFRITGVPTILGEFTVTAGTSSVFGDSASFAPVPGGEVQVGTITVIDHTPVLTVTKMLGGTQIIQREVVSVAVSENYNGGAPIIELYENGVHVGTATEPPFVISYSASSVSGQLALTARASYLDGKILTSAPTLFDVVPDPGMSITGRITDSNGQPVAGLKAEVFGANTVLDNYSPWDGPLPPPIEVSGAVSALTDNNGTFTLTGVPTVRGNIAVTALTTGEPALFDYSLTVAPVPNGIADVGTMTLRTDSPDVRLNLPVGGGLLTQDIDIFFQMPVANFGTVSAFQLYANGSLHDETPHFPWVDNPFVFYYDTPSAPGLLRLKGAVKYYSGATPAESAERLIQIVPSPTTSIRGRVVDELGKPVFRARVEGNGWPYVRTDKDGYFQMARVPFYPGNTYVVSVYTSQLAGESNSFQAIQNGLVDVGTFVVRPNSGSGGGSD